MARLMAALAHAEGRAALVRLVRHLHPEQRTAILAVVEQAWERGRPLAETHWWSAQSKEQEAHEGGHEP